MVLGQDLETKIVLKAQKKCLFGWKCQQEVKLTWGKNGENSPILGGSTRLQARVTRQGEQARFDYFCHLKAYK